jgi:hypothetical protein
MLGRFGKCIIMQSVSLKLSYLEVTEVNERMERCGIYSRGAVYDKVEGSCEYVNEISGYIHDREFL